MNKSVKDIKNRIYKEANLKEDAKNLGIGIAGGIITNIAQDQWQLARDRKNKKDQWELAKSLVKNKKKEGEVEMDIQKKASEILKEAKENNDKKEIKKDIITGAIGAKMLHSSKDKILGQKTLYHGTSSKNWKSIKKEGLRADKGGIGGFGQGTDSVDLAHDSKGMVHVTGKKNKAKMYAKAGDALDNIKKTPEYKRLEELKDRIENDRASLKDFDDFSVAEANLNKAKVKQLFESKGKVAKIKMDYNKYKKMEIAPHETGAIYGELAKRTKNKNVKKILTDKGKHIAARGTIDITPDEIVGLHNPAKRLAKTVKNIPHYAKTNKGRFGTGLALAGAGGTLMSKSVKDIKNRINRKGEAGTNIQKKASEILKEAALTDERMRYYHNKVDAIIDGKDSKDNRSSSELRKSYRKNTAKIGIGVPSALTGTTIVALNKFKKNPSKANKYLPVGVGATIAGGAVAANGIKGRIKDNKEINSRCKSLNKLISDFNYELNNTEK